MNSLEFQRILHGAIDGNHDDLELILSMYEPMINKYSMINGFLDEDLKQYIMIHIALNISKFYL